MDCCATQGLIPVETALETLLSQVSPVSNTHSLALADAIGFVLAEDIRSPINVPPFANSAMDGYAVRIADLEQSLTLPVAGKSFAGIPFEGEWQPQTTIRIMTGAKIPEGCDAVIMQELTAESDAGITFELNLANVKPQANIRPIGDDVSQGQTVLAKGHRLTPRDIPLIASLGINDIPVVDKPKVAFFSTGDELKPLGQPLEDGQIYDSNRYGIKVLIERFGCEAIDLGIIPDCPETLKEVFLKADKEADVVITSGGVSVGEADYTKDILDELGQIGFWKLAIKPGKPFAFGQLPNSYFCGLPGNPVSAMLTMYVLVQPMLAKLAGHTKWETPKSIPAKATSAFKKHPGRTDYQRGIYSINEQGQFEVSTTGNQGSGAFSSMSIANCFVVLERERGRVEAGETVNIELFNASLY
ncbi:molybdopterin molybdenumtransferase MoeA [Aliivibrio fischeri]|uniref:molybdopterin molybdotransferase MoeA n=1 Tax=Aliivibrio fischeri TaxID=668 RepID=UPI0002FFF8F9|nr:molybdopterin molybdotransferase MoeA [Aliivibrio fischeri]OCH02233.1 molybdopterin molybdenumtransferase MoeA [Aliivibrio fischeri]OCH58402.1 molybdopterin molybdenumtransferase MoeA [Aliivibrio fischeri]OEE30519.1 molybdopterin molybdenumtransferase MoeA [Aliivibrio fischeri ZF-211]